MWLLCRKNIINSFRFEIIDGIFDDFKYSTINSKVSQLIINKVIIPDAIAKLKSNMIFKIGFMVKNFN
ncbi:hypothetical protein BLX88_06450 [Bacillus obstructivus]|nr:hypothetical protein BLX88_06450 [Bacillus obstructivus]